jgi:glycosyltransferase involved in cell wall biosynthesis
MNSNSFSVVMPTYDRDDLYLLFDEAIKSCLSNTVLPDEIIVIVDGPVRPSFVSKIQSFEKLDCVKVIWLPENVGLTQALNEGLKHVTSKYVFRADGDDINRPGRFALQLDMLSRGYSLCGGAICERDQDGRTLAIKRVPLQHDSIVRYGLRRCPFNHMTVAFELKVVRDVGGYPNYISEVGLGEDWALWMLLLKSGVRAVNTDEILVDAATDIAMYKRRGGLRKIVSELKMQRFLVTHSGKNMWLALFDLAAKSAFFIVPSKIRGLIYTKFLRDVK